MTDIEGWQSRANINKIRSLKEKKKHTKRKDKYFKIKLKKIFLA